MSESKISIKASENGPNEVTVLRNIEQSLIARHPSNHSWEHLEEVIRTVQKEFLADFKTHLELSTTKITNSYEPFNLTISFWRKKRLQVKNHIKFQPVWEKDLSEQVEDFLDGLPKLFNRLRKAHTSGKHDTLMVAFEWLDTVDSAPAKKIAEMLARKEAGIV